MTAKTKLDLYTALIAKNAILGLKNKKLIEALGLIIAAHESDGDGTAKGVAVLSPDLVRSARDAVALAKGE